MKEIPIYRHVGGRVYGLSARVTVVGHAKVDDWWFDRLSTMGIWLEQKGSKTSYARLSRTWKTKVVFMHQVVFGAYAPDHIDGNGLNNQETNLRPATASQQQANHSLRRDSSSGEPGVSWHKARGTWKVRVFKDGKSVFCKYFADFNEAVLIARQKRKEIHGEFIRS